MLQSLFPRSRSSEEGVCSGQNEQRPGVALHCVWLRLVSLGGVGEKVEVVGHEHCSQNPEWVLKGCLRNLGDTPKRRSGLSRPWNSLGKGS